MTQVSHRGRVLGLHPARVLALLLVPPLAGLATGHVLAFILIGPAVLLGVRQARVRAAHRSPEGNCNSSATKKVG